MRHRWSSSSRIAAALLALGVVAGCSPATSKRPAAGAAGEPASGELLTLRAAILRAEDRREAGAAVLDAARHPEPEIRAAAVRALGRIADRRHAAVVTGALGDEAPAVRAAAAFALGLLGDRASAGTLAEHAADPAAEVRAAVADGLGLLADPRTAHVVKRLLADADPSVLVAASLAVARFEQPDFAVDGLLALGTSGEREVLLAATDTLARLSSRPGWLEPATARTVRARMIELTDSPYAELRRLGAIGLTVPGNDPEAAAVGDLVSDAEPEVRCAAIGALSFPGAPIDPFLRKVLDDPDERVLLAVVDGLGRMRGADVLEQLALVVASKRPLWLREAAVRALGRASRLSAKLANGLSRAEEPELREATASTLIGRIDDETQEYARRLYADTDDAVRAAIIPAFAELDGRLTDLLSAAIDSDRARIRAAVAVAAGRRLAGEGVKTAHAVDDALAVLRRLWDHSREDFEAGSAIVEAAARATPDPRARALLEEALAAPDRRVRVRAISALRRVYGEDRAAAAGPAADRPLEFYVDVLRWAERPRAARVTVARPGEPAAHFTLRLDAREAPLAVRTFADLAATDFYDGLPVFRVVPAVLFQTGDPRGDGSGMLGFTVRDELRPHRFWPGTVALVAPRPDEGASQWLVTLRSQPQLAGQHTVIGEIVQNFGGVVTRMLPSDRIFDIKVYEGDGIEPLPSPPPR